MHSQPSNGGIDHRILYYGEEEQHFVAHKSNIMLEKSKNKYDLLYTLNLISVETEQVHFYTANYMYL